MNEFDDSYQDKQKSLVSQNHLRSEKNTEKIQNIEQEVNQNKFSCNRRQLDNLYSDICEKKLSAKQSLNRIKSGPTIVKMGQLQQIKQQSSSRRPKPQSLQYQIRLSHYRQLLRQSFDDKVKRDALVDSLQSTYLYQLQENQQLRNQNQKLKKIIEKQAKHSRIQQNKIIKLQKHTKKLAARCQSLFQQFQINQIKAKTQIKTIKQENLKYRNLVDALKESIHILNGKKVKDLSQIWKEWQSIFELASLQRCKVKRKQ